MLQDRRPRGIDPRVKQSEPARFREPEEWVMELRDLGPDSQPALEQTLGYLNFSSGAPDALFLGHLNQLFAEIRDHRDQG